MSSITFSEESARETMEISRLEVMECEKEIQAIKNSLKSLNIGASAESEGGSLNSLKVSIHTVKFSGEKEGEAPSCTFKVHLSSPIEERTIVKMHDPLDPNAEGSFALFESVETSNALLTIEAFSGADAVKIGVSAAHDLLPLCDDMKLMSGGDESKSLTVDFAIVSENGEEHEEDKVDESGDDANLGEEKRETETSKVSEGDSEPLVDDDAEKGEEENNDVMPKEDSKDEAPGDAVEEIKPAQDATDGGNKESKVQVPVCTLSVHLEYTPSLNDKRDALYDQLNEVSKRKAAAIDSLRKNASAVNRAKIEEGSSGADRKSAAVKSGFLNKPKASGKVAPPPFWQRWYEKTIGPKSMLWVVGPIAKNYVIFFAVSAFFHYKGDLLALPPPV
jgi:hypothetical protein